WEDLQAGTDEDRRGKVSLRHRVEIKQQEQCEWNRNASGCPAHERNRDRRVKEHPEERQRSVWDQIPQENVDPRQIEQRLPAELTAGDVGSLLRERRTCVLELQEQEWVRQEEAEQCEARHPHDRKEAIPIREAPSNEEHH